MLGKKQVQSPRAENSGMGGNWNLWTKCTDPPTRWNICEPNLDKEEAHTKEVVGNGRSQKYQTSLVYRAVPAGQTPDTMQ